MNLEKYVQDLAAIINTHESNARVMISLLIGYPIAFLYSILIYKLPPRVQHLYLLVLGLILYCWNFGFNVVHMVIAITFTYSVLKQYPATGFSVVAVLIFNSLYLFTGYVIHLDHDGIISWTTPFCILYLRLIGLAWDLYDGKKAISERSDYQKRVAISRLPGLLEVFAFCFVPTAFMIGPQFPIRHYQQFIGQSLRPTILYEHLAEYRNILRNKKIQRIATRLFMAAVYLVIFVKLSPIFNLEYITTAEFLEQRSLFYKLSYMGAYAKLCIIRYFVIWLIAEGASVLLGLGCTGRVIVTDVTKSQQGDKNDAKRSNAVLSDKSGAVFPCEYDIKKLLDDVKANRVKVTEAEHTACANVSVVRFEMATNTDGFVSGHNINTNKWMLEYVYKRFRFLGNKYLSQIFTLCFLALWHGFHSGYYVNFFLEFITVVVEKDVLSIVKLSKHRHFLYETWPGVILTNVAGRLHMFFLLGTPLVCFTLLKSAQYLPVLHSTYWVAFIYLLWPLGRPLFKMAFPRKRTVTVAAERQNENNGTAATEQPAQEKAADEDPLDAATKLRRRSKAAVDEGAMDEEEEERSAYDENAKIVHITDETTSEESKKNE